MGKKQSMYTVKSAGRMIVIFLFFSTVISTLGYTLVHNLYRINQLNDELAALEVEEEVLLEEEEALNADIKRLSDSMYIARYAREKYFYSKEGEIILRMED